MGRKFKSDGPKKVTVVDGIELVNVHHVSRCSGQTCVVHNPLNHHMRSWQLIWRGDRSFFERICPHNIGHPDPSQLPFWRATAQTWQSAHGCDGCCRVDFIEGEVVVSEIEQPLTQKEIEA